MIPLHLYYAAIRAANRPLDERSGRSTQGTDARAHETMAALTGVPSRAGRDAASPARPRAVRPNRSRIELLLRRIALFALVAVSVVTMAA